MKIELNIFTNAIPSAPSTHMIEQTYNSFIERFGKIDNVRVWYHPAPNTESADQYRENLKKLFGDIVTDTRSLSDGYIQSIKTSSSDFMFMLEHDWIFLDNIVHSLEEITSTMKEHDIWHLRFNKRQNEAVGCDKWIQEKNFTVPVCFTPCVSNNPHIINKNQYIKTALPMIKISKTSQGIEGNISNKGLVAAIYGKENYPKTIKHLDGRERKKNKNAK